jgi:haloalkane dehalogenase
MATNLQACFSSQHDRTRYSSALEHFRERTFLGFGNARVCYRKVGAGPPLVLFHGFPLSSQTWRKIVPQLSERFTCYAFDLIGFGHSTSLSASDFSSEGEAKLFQRALFALGVPSYSLIGNDSGGWIARELALLEPARVRKLLLTNTEIPGHRPPWIRLYQTLAQMPGGSYLFRQMLGSRRWRRSSMGFGGCFTNLDLIDGEFAREFLEPLLSSHDRILTALRFLANMNFQRVDRFAELHRRLTMPVGLVWGADDPTFPEADARLMVSQFPNVMQFISIPKGKLFMHEEQPDSLVSHIVKFLEGP